MSAKPQRLMVVCPVCGPPTVIDVADDDGYVRCSACRARVRTVTRRVADLRSERLRDHAHTRYQLSTSEGDGRVRSRSFVATPGMRVRPGDWVTLVWLRGALFGVADQQRHLWFAVQRRRADLALPWWALVMLGACVALALVQAVALGGAVVDLIAEGQAAAVAALVAIGAVVFMPAVLWAVRTGWGEEIRARSAIDFDVDALFAEQDD